ncbi:hypothetical protein GCM10011490_20590 [Pseudoclavibacter endophyticus]|uniref:DinB family protein n=1 Tax=Pseudoclavibacter endophyticus TaxID=1778590 RepID=A0A6H9WGH3_9MICO|nr:DinB family protein [Pseudoclavibacter endophyticus]KAB1648114.1 DinB family protein [Pseudoclavibacter endophyticus]GGA69850.1 hypothetical protein GCM10011490_20590 [Pseudoclavibacter endophyticus]
MDAIDVLRDLANRPRRAAEALRDRLDPEVLNAHPGGHDNSVAWLLWHSGREIDAQLAPLSGADPVWSTQEFDQRFDLGPLGETHGYGHTPEQAHAIAVDDAALLLDYLGACFDALDAYLGTLDEAALDEVIDRNWQPPVTRGVRLISLIDDAAQHIAQAAYVLGMPRRD